MVRLRSPAPIYGGFPERPKGADCKSVVTDFGGPNPPSPTNTKAYRKAVGFLCCRRMVVGPPNAKVVVNQTHLRNFHPTFVLCSAFRTAKKWSRIHHPPPEKSTHLSTKTMCAFFNEICPVGNVKILWRVRQRRFAVKYLLCKCEIFANANVGKFHFTSNEVRYFTIH